jgi:NAD(P)H-hydrate epimerase
MKPVQVHQVPSLPKRDEASHKGTFGHVLLIAGGRGKGGAAAMAGASALRSGAGLVTVATPAEVQPTVAGFEPSYMTYPLSNDEDGLIDFGRCRSVLERLISSADVLAVGPGLGQSPRILDLVTWLVESANKPLVLDADALNVLDGRADILSKAQCPVIVTPHPGEFARLEGNGRSIAQIQADRQDSAVTFARRFERIVVVLKGFETIVTDGKSLYCNTTGNPGMARGGSGDILTGVIAALLGQKLAPFCAAQLGAYAHGLAGDIARDHNGEVGMIAGDIVDSLPDVFEHLAREDA